MSHREAASHAERSARYGIHTAHVLEEEVRWLRAELRDAKHDLGRMTFERDAARETAARYEEIIAKLSGAEHGTVFVDVQ